MTKNIRKILYIEDNPANLRLVEQIIGCIPNAEIFGAPEALLGIELAEQHKPDLILLDINLPKMDGYEALIKLKKIKELSGVPVIAISANAMSSDIKKGLDAGFVAYITKPINIEKFIENINKYLPKHIG
ncbi:MAG: response regulator [Woeseiaceae bacterium]